MSEIILLLNLRFQQQLLPIQDWLLPISLILGSLIAGLIFERIILKRLQKFAANTDFFGQEVVFAALQHKTLIWFFLGGLYAAILTFPLASNVSELLKDIITVIFLLTVTLGLATLATGFIGLAAQKAQGGFPATSLLANLAKVLIFVFGILMILQALEIPITPLIATLGIGSLAVALAFQDTLANLYAGIFLIASKQVRPSDYIRLESGEEGYVTDITWRSTTIREIPNNLIVIPNSKLSSALFKNYHLPAKEIVLKVPVGISYDSDLEQVEQITIDVARFVMQNVPGAVPDYEPFILYEEFGDSSINFNVFLRVNEFFDQRRVRHEFIKKLHRRYQEEGIEIPFPIRTLYMKNQGE